MPDHLPRWEDYSASDLGSARAAFPAVDRYLRLLGESTPSDPSEDLRLIRHRHWASAALATYFAKVPAHLVCRTWSDAADQLIQMAWQQSGGGVLQAGIWALGKLGAQELNLSSDVDLIIVSAPNELTETEKVLRRFVPLLNSNTDFGFALRIDLDLRPGGRFGPTLTTPEQLADYYWNQGETWERLAWLRGRPLLGDPSLINQVAESIQKFCFRKYLDFTLMDDLRLLRQRIHAAASRPAEEFNLKLSVGGIRDIELFVHALLLIHGGRRPEIRTRSTSGAIDNLRDHNLLRKEDAAKLAEGYWFYRELENLLQAREDRQSHILCQTDQSFPQVRALSQEVDRLVSDLLGPVKPQAHVWPEAPEAQLLWLKEQGFSDQVSQEVWPQLLTATAVSLKSERDELARREFLNQFLKALREQGLDSDLGLRNLLDFVRATRAKASFFTLLLHEPRLTRDLALLLSVSPYLGQIVASRPELVDSLVLRSQERWSQEWEPFLDELAERRLLNELLAISQLLRSLDPNLFTQSLSSTADLICTSLLDRLKVEHDEADVEILALGKWGSRELGVRSDLDFVLLTSGTQTPQKQKIAKRLISRLSDVHKGGRIYSIDLRLRPSGAAGPLLVSQSYLQDYLLNQAAAWERQAYLRARRINGQSCELIGKVLAKGLSPADQKDLIEIRQKLFTSPEGSEGLNLKMGHGGLAMVEFTAQIAILKHGLPFPAADTISLIHTLMEALPSWNAKGEELKHLYQSIRLCEQLYQVVASHSGSSLRSESKEFERLAQLHKTRPPTFAQDLRQQLDASFSLLKDLDPLQPGG